MPDTPSNRWAATLVSFWLDGFSTQKNSELWTVDFFGKIKAVMGSTGGLFTYCSAIPVRAGLAEAGFWVGETKPFGRERGGTAASLLPLPSLQPLPDRDQFLMASSRGTPYRDPNGTRTNREILRAREYEILASKEKNS